jgi:tetratricopeptide (TPR) repeat protein
MHSDGTLFSQGSGPQPDPSGGFVVPSFFQLPALRKRTLLSALMLGVIAQLSAHSTQTPASHPITDSDNRMFQQAMASLNAGNPSAAEPLLRELHGRHPDNYEIDESLGLLYASDGRLAPALPLLSAAAREKPDADVAHANLGTAYLKLGRTADAARELARAAELNPSNAATQQALGQAWMLLKQPGKAADAFEAALPANDSNPDLLYNTALALYDCGKASQAEPLLARMPGVESSAEAQSLYGDVDEKLSRYEDAARHYAAAVQLQPSEANLYVLGIEFLRHWTFDPAAKEFAAGVRVFPQSQRMHLGLGVALYGGGKYDQAIPVFADLLAQNPDNSMYAELLGRTCTVLTEGQQPQCAALIDYAQKHPKDAVLATYAATSILHQPADSGQLEQAHRLLETAIRTNPNLPEARYGMGLLLQTESQWPQSIPELEAAIRLRPGYASAHYRLAMALSHTGQHEKAHTEIALEQKYNQQEQDGVDARLKQVTTFLVNMQ